MKKKQLCISFVLLLVLLSTTGCFNKNNEYKNLVNQVPNEEEVSEHIEGTEVSAQWGSSSGRSTHGFLVSQALEIIESDKGSSVANKLKNYGDIVAAADLPDEDETTGAYKGHFYDPATKENYKGETDYTALTNFVSHANDAKSKWDSGQYTDAMEALGRACHYLGDLSEPHHTSNLIAFLSNHGTYETWVSYRHSDFAISTSDVYNVFIGVTFSNYCSNVGHYVASKTTDYADEATAEWYDKWTLEWYPDYEQWDYAAEKTLAYGQEYMAAFLYNFLKAVGEV